MGEVENTNSAPVESRKRCAKCGACAVVCPVFRASGNEIYSARGKRHLAEVFEGEKPSPVFEDIYSKCLLCGACVQVCPQNLDITEDVMAARSEFSPFYGEHGYQKYLARKALNQPEMLGAARVLGKPAADILFGRLPALSGLRLRLAFFAQTPMPDQLANTPGYLGKPAGGKNISGSTITYFPGCAARYLYTEIIDSIRSVLGSYNHDIEIPRGLGCCGLATMASGKKEDALALARRNIKALEINEGPILVSCGSCYAQLAHYHKLFENDPVWQIRSKMVSERVVEISVFLESLLEEEAIAGMEETSLLRVFYHDPCHMRHEAGITKEPRAVLTRLPHVELVELPDGPQCCGQGGLFHVGAPELSAKIRDDLGRKILDLNPDVITTTCSGCLMQLKSAMAAAESDVPVVHLSTLVSG